MSASIPIVLNPNNRIAELLEKRGYSEAQIVARLGLREVDTIRRWERGSGMTNAMTWRLAELLQVSRCYLMGWDLDERHGDPSDA